MDRPGSCLRPSSDAELEGPWIDQPTRVALGTRPRSRTRGSCAACRRPPASKTTARQGISTACPLGLSTCVEAPCSRTSRSPAACASGSGYVMVPDADSAVNLTVYSPRWINPEEPAMRARRARRRARHHARRPPAPRRSPRRSRRRKLKRRARLRCGGHRPRRLRRLCEELEAQRDQPQVVDGHVS